MAPFITEELFQILKGHFKTAKIAANVDPYTKEALLALQAEACIVAPYPAVVREKDINPAVENAFELIGKVVYAIRNIRGEIKLPPQIATDVFIVGKEGDPIFETIRQHLAMIAALVKTKRLEAMTAELQVSLAGTGVLDTVKIILPLPEELIAQEKSRLEKEFERLKVSVEKSKSQLANENFVQNAPAELVEKHRKQWEQAQNELQEIERRLSKF
jgi:valyl-tRNA synthetase